MSAGPSRQPAPHVVVVEDDPSILYAQELLLRDWGYGVVSGLTGDAIEGAVQGSLDEIAAIIADFNIGSGQSGADIALNIAQRANRPIPTLLISASLGNRSGEVAKKFGFDMLSKPADPERLRSWLASVISHSADGSPASR